MILDAYGRPVQLEALREEQAASTLAGIRNIYSTIDTSIGLVPDKIVAVLRQAEFGDPWLYLELAERMEEKDELYQGVLHTRKMAVSQLDISVTPAGDSAEEQADADFIEAVLLEGDIDLHELLFGMLDALGKGFSATEIIWNTDGRNPATGAPWWIPERFAWRDPRWFMFDWISGEQLLVRSLRTTGPTVPLGTGQPQLSPLNLRIISPTGELNRGDEPGAIGLQPATEPLAPFKFITHITKAKAGLPIRGGLARIAVWNYFYRNYILKDWATFCEVYSQPLRLGKYGPGATEQDKRALLQAVANIGTDAAAIIPDSMLIEFAETKQTQAHAETYQKISEYLDKRLTIAVLGQELTTSLPHGAGSRAAAQVHDAVRRDIATDDARRISATLRRDLVKPLIELNRGVRRRYPQITIGFAEEEDLRAFADAIGPLIDRGLPVPVSWVQAKFAMPNPENGEAVLHPAEKVSAAAPPLSAGHGPLPRPGQARSEPVSGRVREAQKNIETGVRDERSEEGHESADAAIAGAPLTPLFTDVNGRGRRAASSSHSEPFGPEGPQGQAPRPLPRRGSVESGHEQYSDKIDRFVQSLLEEHSEPATRPIIEPLAAKLHGAKSYAEMKRVVAAAVAEMNHGAFTDLLARAGFNVQLGARIGVKK
jgi:phage gp29-like protein